MGFLAKQPNGLYCYFDDIDDQPKKWNITEDDYISICVESAKKSALDTLENAEEFREVYESFIADDNMTENDFNNFLKEVGCNRKYEDLMGCWDD